MNENLASFSEKPTRSMTIRQEQTRNNTNNNNFIFSCKTRFWRENRYVEIMLEI